MKSKSETIEQTLSFTLLCAVNDAKEPGHTTDVPLFQWRNIILL